MSERSLNRCTFIGRIGQDAATSYTPGGNAVTKFSLATTRNYKQGDEWKSETNWTNIVLWGQEKLGAFLQKGKQVYVEGRLSTRSYEKDGKKAYVTEVVADQVILLGGGQESANGQARPAVAGASARSNSADEAFPLSDDEIPF